MFKFSLVKDLVNLFFTGMSTSYVHLTECPRNQSMVDQTLAWGKRTSRVLSTFLAASIHVWLIPPVSPFSVERGVNGPDQQITSTLRWSTNMEQDAGRAPTEPPRSVLLMTSFFCPHYSTAQEVNRWGLPGVFNLWEGDSCDVHVRAQPLRVLNGVHHPGCLPGAAEPWLTVPSCAYGAVEHLHLWVIHF